MKGKTQMFTVLFQLLDDTSIVASFIEASNELEAIGLAMKEFVAQKPGSGLVSIQVFLLEETLSL
jgi:hypothetical protein